jgi:hypothetical protein
MRHEPAKRTISRARSAQFLTDIAWRLAEDRTGIDKFDGANGPDPAERVITTLLDEAHGSHDEPLVAQGGASGEQDRR